MKQEGPLFVTRGLQNEYRRRKSAISEEHILNTGLPDRVGRKEFWGSGRVFCREGAFTEREDFQEDDQERGRRSNESLGKKG